MNYKIKSTSNNSAIIDATIICSAGEINNNLDGSTTNTKNVGTKKTKVDVEFRLINKNTGAVEYISSENRSIIIEDSRNASMNFQINASNLKWWSVDYPELYKLHVRLRVDGIIIDELFYQYWNKNF